MTGNGDLERDPPEPTEPPGDLRLLVAYHRLLCAVSPPVASAYGQMQMDRVGRDAWEDASREVDGDLELIRLSIEEGL